MNTAIISIIIVTITIISFMWGKISLALTSFIAAIAMGLSGAMPLNDIYAGWGSQTFALSMGMMIVGNAVFETGLAKWVGDKLVGMGIAKNEKLFLIIMMAIAGIMSAFMSNIATMAMLIPLVASVAASSKGKIDSRYLILPIGLATTVGGSGTLVGSTHQVVAQGILEQSGHAMSFFETGIIAFPMLAALMIYMATFGYTIMKKTFDFEPVLEKAALKSDVEIDPNQELTPKMKIAGATLILAIIGFVTGIWNIGTIALLAAFIVMVTGCIEFKHAFATLDWNTLVILATSVGFATGLDKSGGGKMIADFVIGLFGGETASPIILLAAGMDQFTVMTAAALSVGFASTFPSGTPLIGIIYGQGSFEMKELVKVGIGFAIVSYIVVVLNVNFFLPIIFK